MYVHVTYGHTHCITLHHSAQRILIQTVRRLARFAAVLVVHLTTEEENLTLIDKLNLSLLCSMEYLSYIKQLKKNYLFASLCWITSIAWFAEVSMG